MNRLLLLCLARALPAAAARALVPFRLETE